MTRPLKPRCMFMSENNYLKSKKRKSVIALLAAAAVTCTGFAAACAKTDKEEKPTALAPKQEDTQLLKNGNFEFFNYPSEEYIKDGKAVYLIKTADSWTRSGDSSNAMSGIIGTSSYEWDRLTAAELRGKLEYNADIKTTDDDYVDYNGMKARDLLYKDTYAAMLSAEDVEDSYIKYQTYEDYFGITERDGKHYFGDKEVKKRENEGSESKDNEYYFVNEDGSLGESVRFALIDNPGTPFKFTDNGNESYYEDENGKKVTVYKDDNGNHYYDEELKFPCDNVLMVHNFPSNNSYNGISQYFASQTITLEANTAAEISVWVKTSDLKFDKGYSQLDDQDRGAFIEVSQTVNGTSLDSFKIKAINTEKIISQNKDNPSAIEQNNGWLKYTIYVNACDFADSTIQLNLGLGQSANSEKCTGYAFFDNVSVEKFRSLDEKALDDNGNETSEYKSSYNAYATAIEANKTYCTLTSDADDKIFTADTNIRYHGSSVSSPEYLRNSRHFRYLIDLASENGTGVEGNYQPLTFGKDNTTVQLTAQKSEGKWYAVGTLDGETVKNNSIVSGINKSDTENYNLPKNVKGGIDTSKDLAGVFGTDGINGISGFDYSKKLNDALTGDNGFDKLPGYASGNNMLVLHSARGAAYTSAVSATTFTLGYDERMIVSFWVKTADMGGTPAATVKITDVDDEDSSATFTVDTTNKTTSFGDDKDIYNGWVRCFMFVENTCDDKDEVTGEYVSKTFKMEFSFGVTDVANASASSFNYGWAAFANLQTLKINEKIYGLTSAGDTAVKFSFTEDGDDNDHKGFADASGISDVKKEISKPGDYNGVNGGSSSVSDNIYSDGYDAQNTNGLAGLINKDGFKDYANWQTIRDAFNSSNSDAVAAWNEVFGEDCYQPLIIINNLRQYIENASANENTYTNYYILAEDDYSGNVVSYNGKKYRRATSDDKYSEDTEYFSFAVNYGFVSENKNVAADSYQTVSIKVKASNGANAYVYLVDSNTREVLTYSTPKYTFYYDDEGNVLNTAYDKDDMTDEEHRAAIVYKLRKDGLYESVDSTDKTLYANLNNLTKSYKYYKYETRGKYFTDDKGVNEILFDDLVDGETYYYQDGKVADHFLCTESGKRVYEYVDGTYYYLVDGKRENAVKSFDTEKAPYRYVAPENSTPYMVNIDNATYGDDWVTVNFFIHTGSEGLDYRIEVWNGERGSSGINEDGTYTTGAVAFDYSAYSATSDNYSTLRSEYETKLINQYKQILESKNLLDKAEVKTETVAFFESLVKELIADGSLTENDVKGVDEYSALYYTYTLYDSAAYEPFNADTAAEGETGYEYKISDNAETLGFFIYENKEENSYNVFADYSAVDKNVERTTVEDDGDEDKDEDEDPTNFWLYIASIVLVVALLVTLVSLLLRDLLKKKRRTKNEKSLQKNNYRQRKRYIRKLHLVENEDTDGDAPVADEAESTDENVADEAVENEVIEEAPAEEVSEDVTEATDTDDNTDDNGGEVNE